MSKKGQKFGLKMDIFWDYT